MIFCECVVEILYVIAVTLHFSRFSTMLQVLSQRISWIPTTLRVVTNQPNFRTFSLGNPFKDSDGGRPPIHIENPQSEPTIPMYQDSPNEPIHEKRARLVYQSRKRGILENGLLLASFADKHLSNFDAEQLALYDRLINLPSNDWEIFYWATQVKPVPEEFDNEIMTLLINHAKNENRESRISQPNLK